MIALFIGRFQPFHLGHLKVIQYASSRYQQIIIGIGSSQYQNTAENPFSYEERKQMITQSLKEQKISNYKILSIADIHNPPKWVDHVISIVKKFDIVLTNNTFTNELFTSKGYTVDITPIFNRKQYSGKGIRKRIQQEEPWEELVPSSVVKSIDEIKGVQRIKNLGK